MDHPTPSPKGNPRAQHGPTAGAIPEAGLRVRTSVGLRDLCFSGGGGQRSGAGAEMGEGLTKTPSHMGKIWENSGKIWKRYEKIGFLLGSVFRVTLL